MGKKTNNLTVFLGSVRVKAASKMLEKLTPDLVRYFDLLAILICIGSRWLSSA
jgi:hypothetical protein